MRYIVVGGNPFRCYTGTTTYTGLSIVAKCHTLGQANAAVTEHYEACGGLIMIIDTATGEAV